jgi:hypothetical protein
MESRNAVKVHPVGIQQCISCRTGALRSATVFVDLDIPHSKTRHRHWRTVRAVKRIKREVKRTPWADNA